MEKMIDTFSEKFGFMTGELITENELNEIERKLYLYSDEENINDGREYEVFDTEYGLKLIKGWTGKGW